MTVKKQTRGRKADDAPALAVAEAQVKQALQGRPVIETPEVDPVPPTPIDVAPEPKPQGEELMTIKLEGMREMVFIHGKHGNTRKWIDASRLVGFDLEAGTIVVTAREAKKMKLA